MPGGQLGEAEGRPKLESIGKAVGFLCTILNTEGKETEAQLPVFVKCNEHDNERKEGSRDRSLLQGMHTGNFEEYWLCH